MSTTIADLGEFGLIARVTARFPQSDDVILGPGDDAAILRAPDKSVVATTDLLVEGRHFRRHWSSARDVGCRAAAQNFADIAAMGARPTGLLVGLAAPPELPVEWPDGLAEGLREECARAGAAVVGGDVVRADSIMVSITALGDLGGRSPIRRDGAAPGDIIAVTGNLGLSAAGWSLLECGLDSGASGASSADDADEEPCVAAYRRPAPPYPDGLEAAEMGATAMLDVSDGLLQDLGHIAQASGVGIALSRAALHPSPALAAAAARMRRDPVGFMLTGGEDHALAAAFPAHVDLPEQWSVIGRVTGGAAVAVDGKAVSQFGWDHFGEDGSAEPSSA